MSSQSPKLTKETKTPKTPNEIKANGNRKSSDGKKKGDNVGKAIALDDSVDISERFNLDEMFFDFDMQYFAGLLTKNPIEISWSNRLTTSAGITYDKNGTEPIKIRISTKLHQRRSAKELMESVLHEMIHAFLFTFGERDGNRSHGEEYVYHMDRINKLAGLDITIQHTFDEEVEQLRNEKAAKKQNKDLVKDLEKKLNNLMVK